MSDLAIEVRGVIKQTFIICVSFVLVVAMFCGTTMWNKSQDIQERQRQRNEVASNHKAYQDCLNKTWKNAKDYTAMTVCDDLLPRIGY